MQLGLQPTLLTLAQILVSRPVHCLGHIQLALVGLLPEEAGLKHTQLIRAEQRQAGHLEPLHIAVALTQASLRMAPGLKPTEVSTPIERCPSGSSFKFG